MPLSTHQIFVSIMEKDSEGTPQQRLNKIEQEYTTLGEGFDGLVEGENKELLKKALKR